MPHTDMVHSCCRPCLILSCASVHMCIPGQIQHSGTLRRRLLQQRAQRACLCTAQPAVGALQAGADESRVSGRQGLQPAAHQLLKCHAAAQGVSMGGCWDGAMSRHVAWEWRGAACAAGLHTILACASAHAGLEGRGGFFVRLVGGGEWVAEVAPCADRWSPLTPHQPHTCTGGPLYLQGPYPPVALPWLHHPACPAARLLGGRPHPWPCPSIRSHGCHAASSRRPWSLRCSKEEHLQGVHGCV